VGTVTKDANGTWSWAFTTGDGPTQSQTVVVTATDSDGAMSSTSFQLAVSNVAPTITALSASNGTNGRRFVTVQGAFSDPGLLDTHVATVDWGDGSAPQTVTVDELSQTFAGGHQYGHGGSFNVTVTMTDSDGAATSRATSVKVTGNNLVNGTLYVVGTSSADRIDIGLAGTSGPKSKGKTLHLQTS